MRRFREFWRQNKLPNLIRASHFLPQWRKFAASWKSWFLLLRFFAVRRRCWFYVWRNRAVGWKRDKLQKLRKKIQFFKDIGWSTFADFQASEMVTNKWHTLNYVVQDVLWARTDYHILIVVFMEFLRNILGSSTDVRLGVLRLYGRDFSFAWHIE